MSVYAAGVLGWRNAPSGLEFVLVNREKYQDWAFAKGKQDPGEFLPETAVREFFEETGLKVRLGRKLDVMTYPLPNGETKEVHYWVGRVTEKAQRKSRFVPNDEIAQLEWFAPQKALERLSYEHDRDLLNKAVEWSAAGTLETRAVIVLRHATATPRVDWKRGEDTRPLLPAGVAEAQRLIPLLDAYGPKLLVTSSWRRCKETLAPYATFKKRVLVERSQFSELGSKNGPKRLTRLLGKLLQQRKSSVICTHRPALPLVLGALSVGDAGVKEEAAKNHDLRPAEFAVLRFSDGARPALLDVERVSWTSK